MYVRVNHCGPCEKRRGLTARIRKHMTGTMIRSESTTHTTSPPTVKRRGRHVAVVVVGGGVARASATLALTMRSDTDHPRPSSSTPVRCTAPGCSDRFHAKG